MSKIEILIGMHVDYRFWESEDWHTGTVKRVWTGVYGSVYVDIKRDGYNETAVMPADKIAPATFRFAR